MRQRLFWEVQLLIFSIFEESVYQEQVLLKKCFLNRPTTSKNTKKPLGMFHCLDKDFGVMIFEAAIKDAPTTLHKNSEPINQIKYATEKKTLRPRVIWKVQMETSLMQCIIFQCTTHLHVGRGTSKKL